MLYDLHCDTLLKVGRDGHLNHPRAMIQLTGLRESGTALQCFANFVPTGLFPGFCRSWLSQKCYLHTYRSYQAMLRYNSDSMMPVLTASDLDAARAQGKIGVLLTIEDGGVLGGELEHIRKAWEMGVRLITLTWNQANAIGSPNSKKPKIMAQGLTDFGRQAVREMERLGILVDVSHASDGVFWDVAQMATKPFVASHSNSRAVCNHTRNLTDDMIRALAQCGGVMGLNLEPCFLKQDARHSAVKDMVRHICHIRAVGGIEVLALGSDFDGISGTFEIAGPQDWHKLFDALRAEGFTESELEALQWKNADRVLRTVL